MDFNLLGPLSVQTHEVTHSGVLPWLLAAASGYGQGVLFMRAFADLSSSAAVPRSATRSWKSGSWPWSADLLSRARRVKIDIAHEGERLSATREAVAHRDVVERSLRLSPQMDVRDDDIAVRLSNPARPSCSPSSLRSPRSIWIGRLRDATGCGRSRACRCCGRRRSSRRCLDRARCER